jgi:hypothetical protein
MYPLLNILAPEIEGDPRRFLSHRIGARNFTGGRTQVKFQFTKGWDETWGVIKELRPGVYSLKVYSVVGKSTRWKPDPRSPGGMKPPSRGQKRTIVDRGQLNAEQLRKTFMQTTGIIL